MEFLQCLDSVEAEAEVMDQIDLVGEAIEIKIQEVQTQEEAILTMIEAFVDKDMENIEEEMIDNRGMIKVR
jgi:hypothetical protein